MATVAYQGFAVKNNLLEASADRQIINNLGGTPLGDDITLLYNNKRNTSTLVVDPTNINGSIISFPITINISPAVFTNKTKVIFNNSETFYVKESNGINEFKLSTLSDLSDTVENPQPGTYTRSDEITLENISNFSAIRRSTDLNAVQTETLTGYLNRSANVLGSSTSIDLLQSIESNLDFYKFKRSNAIIKIGNFLSDNITDIKGYVKIEDSSNVNSSALDDTGPGIFIYNPNTGTGRRAFSSNENPWIETTGQAINYLETFTNKIDVGTLRFSNFDSLTGYSELNNIVIISKNSILTTDVPESTIVSSVNFTHKVPITVNGETYFLCLNQNIS